MHHSNFAVIQSPRRRTLAVIGDGEIERLCRLYIDDELEVGRLLDWQVAGLLAFEDAVDVGTRAYKGQDRRRRKTPGLIFKQIRKARKRN
jgi:hypothetical protein